jgi:hypothetical protein
VTIREPRRARGFFFAIRVSEFGREARHEYWRFDVGRVALLSRGGGFCCGYGRSAQLCVDGCESCIDFGAYVLDDADNYQRDAGGDQAIFDGRRS